MIRQFCNKMINLPPFGYPCPAMGGRPPWEVRISSCKQSSQMISACLASCIIHDTGTSLGGTAAHVITISQSGSSILMRCSNLLQWGLMGRSSSRSRGKGGGDKMPYICKHPRPCKPACGSGGIQGIQGALQAIMGPHNRTVLVSPFSHTYRRIKVEMNHNLTLLLFVVTVTGYLKSRPHSENKKYFRAPILVLQLVTNRGLMQVP